MKRYLILWVLTLSLLTPSVWALTLDEARTQGRVGETLNGYLVALKNDAETQKLVLDINHARRASYQQLADSNHLPVDEVAKMAGQKLVERARPGEYVQGINGKWMRK
ncbi:YdbL family protein [Salmonella enterica]|nr:YdbL family protein [Salmonella enterica]EKR4211738.1 YdbL family protein [Salmonella enterica]